MKYDSTTTIKSRVCPGATFTVLRMSFGRRLELTRAVREVARRLDFDHAGEKTGERLDGAIASAEVDRLYLQWGLQRISGLEIDGEPATCESLIAAGPEGLCREIISEIKRECGLSEDERKN